MMHQSDNLEDGFAPMAQNNQQILNRARSDLHDPNLSQDSTSTRAHGFKNKLHMHGGYESDLTAVRFPNGTNQNNVEI